MSTDKGTVLQNTDRVRVHDSDPQLTDLEACFCKYLRRIRDSFQATDCSLVVLQRGLGGLCVIGTFKTATQGRVLFYLLIAEQGQSKELAACDGQYAFFTEYMCFRDFAGWIKWQVPMNGTHQPGIVDGEVSVFIAHQQDSSGSLVVHQTKILRHRAIRVCINRWRKWLIFFSVLPVKIGRGQALETVLFFSPWK